MKLLVKQLFFASVLATTGCATDVGFDDDDDDVGVLPDGGTAPPPVGTPDGGVRPDGGTLPDAGGTNTCGNRAVDPGEECDDGNLADNDGCSGSCILESAFAGDVCPGATIALAQTGSALHGTVTGTTAGAYNQYGSACGGGSGPDAVYSFTPTTSGKAVVTFTGDYLGIVSARTTCADTASESACSAMLTAGATNTFEFPVFAGTPSFLFVDGYAGASGNFTLDVDISLAACGNGLAELPERCDDGNLTDGDGCTATCAFEAGGVLNQCPGQPFLLSGAAGAPRTVSFAGNTLTEGADTTNGIATGCFFADGNEMIYAVQSDVEGSAHVQLTAGYRRSAVHVRRECAVRSYQVDCAVSVAPGDTDLDLPVSAGEWFYVFVDGLRDFGGPFTATVTVTPRACGNGRLDGGEACDDANQADGDGCSATCTLEDTPAADTCGGFPVTLTAQAGEYRGLVSGTTVGRAAKVPPCGDGQSDVGEPPTLPGDAIYSVVAPVDGRLEVELQDEFQGVVSILSASPCNPRVPTSSAARLPNVLGCSYGSWIPANFAADPYVIAGLSGDKVASAPVVQGSTYFVVVDSYVGKSNLSGQGPFTLRLAVREGLCGNGELDAAEACDDGNLRADDGCDASCAVEANLPDTCATAKSVMMNDSGGGTFRATVYGSTENLASNQEFGNGESNAGVCSAPGPDAYYRVVAPTAGVLQVTSKSEAFDLVLGLRDTCSVNTRPLACSNGGSRGSDETVRRVVAAGDELYVIVDSPSFPKVNFCASGTILAGCDDLVARGLFDLDVSLAPSTCGDGFFVAGPNEQCDDGNGVDGDGCSATCTLEALAGIDTCPGYALDLPVDIDGAYRNAVAVNTASLAANYSGACGGSGPDGVIRVVAPAAGTLTARVSNLDGATVYARAVCNDPITEFLKTPGSDTCPSVVHDVVSFPAEAGTEYFLFVDGLDGVSGVPTLEVAVVP